MQEDINMTRAYELLVMYDGNEMGIAKLMWVHQSTMNSKMEEETKSVHR